MNGDFSNCNDLALGWCEYCSSGTTKVFHQGKCPKIKSIEYHLNGTVKKIEFHSDSNGAQW